MINFDDDQSLQVQSYTIRPDLQRRGFMSRLAAGAGIALASAAANLAAPARIAKAAGEYKALVCIYLVGGNDGANMIVPTDPARRALYDAARGSIGVPLGTLTALRNVDYALHPLMAALTPAWNNGQLAGVFNVGPLVRPVTKHDLLSGDASLLPPNLFSHSDQQKLWEVGGANSNRREGWGGAIAEHMQTANPVISVAGGSRFANGVSRTALSLPAPGADFQGLNLQGASLTQARNSTRRAALDILLSDGQQTDQLAQQYAQVQRNAFEASDRLSTIIRAVPGLDPAFQVVDAVFAPLFSGSAPRTVTAGRLYQIAKLIAANGSVGGSRQIFYTAINGFDNHVNQVAAAGSIGGTHGSLLRELADAMAAFQQAMTSIGMGEQVTLFTQSDFGRTLKANQSLGSDHGWGNHQLVLGGAVRGGAMYGSFPDLTIGGPDDIGFNVWNQQGRTIPTIAVDEYAASLLQWFGANEPQMRVVLPYLANFNGRARPALFR